ncbi:hypothetical protein [Periweissella beninensis]|uniref:Uncharacterized protein n=1 Tax=Periweissella beninensis TaxID=504936 RepID=A0ABT0VH76_9LACO|nr:hypothetical protein [Periweissella beninensis]MBM7543511.1 hypothetical protein [Periweissella beninensis]MCM2436493.1 hypothetical protein [Periweissella beninensis]MCT4396211.1 hypothetical protein [Periweissella beninensis]
MYQIDERQKYNNVKFSQKKRDEDSREMAKRTMKKFIRDYANKEEMLALIEMFNNRNDVEEIKIK